MRQRSRLRRLRPAARDAVHERQQALARRPQPVRLALDPAQRQQRDAEQAALLAELQRDAGQERVGRSDAERERRGADDRLVQPRVQLAGLAADAGDGDRVLDGAARVGVVAVDRHRRLAHERAEAGVGVDGLDQRAQRRCRGSRRSGTRGSPRGPRCRGGRRGRRRAGRRPRPARRIGRRSGRGRGTPPPRRARAPCRPGRTGRRAAARRRSRPRGRGRCGRRARATGTAHPVRARRRSLRSTAKVESTSRPATRSRIHVLDSTSGMGRVYSETC